MTAEALWAAATTTVTAEYAALPLQIKEALAGLLAEIRRVKQASAALVDAGDCCADCQGICCRFGTHHFSVVDLLGYLEAQQQLITPQFDHPLCPYHSGNGCQMEPALRPFTCIIFICEQIEAGLDDTVRQELADQEQHLRRLYGKIEALLGNRFENGLLITYERSLLSGEPLFRY